MTKDSSVITRFPPSPTGYLHIGGARTALFNYLFAKQHGGQFLVRLEDTDTERSKKEYEKDMLEGLAWLGLKSDNRDIWRQSERSIVYQKYLTRLVEQGSAYEAEKSDNETGNVIRFKNPKSTVVFDDLIRGDVSFDIEELGDFVIAKNTRNPLYHLAVVVDDHEMGVSHVIRGEDHLSNTARQIVLLEALGLKRPTYAHIPLILASDRSKLSKRHSAVSVNEYREMGYLPEALVNYLALLGWHPPGRSGRTGPQDEREIFSMEELMKEFDLSRVQKGGAVFDEEKLRSINKIYLERLSSADFLNRLKSYMPDAIRTLPQYSDERLERAAPVIREHIQVFTDIARMAEAGELEYFFMKPAYEERKTPWKGETPNEAAKHLEYALASIEKIPENRFSESTVKDALWDYATEEGKGSVLWPLRYALSGREKSPDPFVLAGILGKEETLSRVQEALKKLRA